MMDISSSYFLGVDIGSTKSHALIADGTGHVLGFGKGGPGNHEVVGYEGLISTLHEITSQALQDANLPCEAIVGAGFGVSGYDWPSELAPTLDAINTLRLACQVKAANDTVIGLVAGASEGWGVAVVAGTGNNCWGRDRNGREGRMTGNGLRFAEYGGAGELVMRAVQAVSLAWSRRGPETRLTEALMVRFGARSADELLEGLALEWYHLDASAAPLVFQVAQEAIAWAGRELGGLAVGVIRQLGFEDLAFEVVLVGSLYQGGALLIEPMRQTIQPLAPGAHLVKLAAPPVIGGVLLGMETAGLRSPALRERLITEVNCLSI
jgi:N-acetylglucosamine kinase-like BadF-type ATPase